MLLQVSADRNNVTKDGLVKVDVFRLTAACAHIEDPIYVFDPLENETFVGTIKKIDKVNNQIHVKILNED